MKITCTVNKSNQIMVIPSLHKSKKINFMSQENIGCVLLKFKGKEISYYNTKFTKKKRGSSEPEIEYYDIPLNLIV